MILNQLSITLFLQSIDGMPMVHVTYLDNDAKPFKITCQNFKVYVRCSGKSV